MYFRYICNAIHYYLYFVIVGCSTDVFHSVKFVCSKVKGTFHVFCIDFVTALPNNICGSMLYRWTLAGWSLVGWSLWSDLPAHTRQHGTTANACPNTHIVVLSADCNRAHRCASIVRLHRRHTGIAFIFRRMPPTHNATTFNRSINRALSSRRAL